MFLHIFLSHTTILHLLLSYLNTHPENFIYDFPIYQKSLMDFLHEALSHIPHYNLLCQRFLMIILIATVRTLHFPASSHMRSKDYGLLRRDIPLSTVLAFIIPNLSLKFKAVMSKKLFRCELSSSPSHSNHLTQSLKSYRFTSQFFIPMDEKSSLSISLKYDSMIRTRPLCATRIYSLSPALISSRRP